MIRSLLLAGLASLSLAAAEAARPLSDRLLSADRRELTAALLDLARAGPSAPADIGRARSCIDDLDPVVSQAAISAITSLHDDAAVPVLAQVMRGGGTAAQESAHGALVSLAGADIGGRDPDAWQAWDSSVVEATRKGVVAVHAAFAANDEDKARAALHPLLMQRVGRDMVVDILTEAAADRNPRIAGLAREGLSAIDTAYAHLSLAEVNAKQAALAEAAGPGAPPAGPIAAARPDAIVPASAASFRPGTASSAAGILGILVTVAAGAGLGIWFFSRPAAKDAGKQAWTRVFVLKGKPRG